MDRRYKLNAISVVLLVLAPGCSGDSAVPSAQPTTAAVAQEEHAEKPNEPVQVYRLDGRTREPEGDERREPPAGSLRTWPILESKVADARLARELRAAVDDPANFGGVGKDCFWPGMGITLTEGNEQVDLIICLKCDWLYRYRGDKGEVEELVLSPRGNREFTRLYRKMFPQAAKTPSE